MPRTKQLVTALALALAGTGAAQAQEFSSVISFGDSLSDAGQYSVLINPLYGSFTTNPDDVWTQVLASSFGLSQTASEAGGTNYAYGGAPTAFSIPPIPLPINCYPSSLPCHSVQQQIGIYLGSNGGVADPNALYTYWAGANDIFDYLTYVASPPFISAAQAQLFTGASAQTATAELAALQAAGAQNIVVLNLPDIGRTPAFIGNPAASSVSGLVFVYNNVLNQGLATLGDGIIPINAYGLINEVLADPGSYGFSNVTGTACGTLTGSVLCGPAGSPLPYPFHWAAGTDQTYLFADGVHPTGGAHAMLARVVQATIVAPGQVSLAGELPLRVYENHANVVNNQIFSMDRVAREKGESNVYASLQYGKADYDATVNTAAFESNVGSATLGADVRYTDHISLGAAISFGNARGDSFASDIDGKEVLVSAYGVLNWGKGYLMGMASGGSMSLDMDRSIDFTASTRHEGGDTSASHLAFELGGGFTFGNEDFRHGPYASLTNQRVRVHEFSEDSLDSTSMWFSEFTRRSFVTRIGYQAMGSFGAVRPYGRIAYARDTENDGQQVQAGSNTMNGHFTMDGYLPSEHWYEGDVGVEWDLSDSTQLSFAWRGHFNDEGVDVNTLHIGARWEFGGGGTVVEEVAAPAAPAATCADMDDDGDGVDNCVDKCPASPTGEVGGADGCPVPAEPAMEPKPYRG